MKALPTAQELYIYCIPQLFLNKQARSGFPDISIIRKSQDYRQYWKIGKNSSEEKGIHILIFENYKNVFR